MRTRISIAAFFILLTSCMGIDTSHPKEAYNYWAGRKPPRDIIVLNGKYWQSSHFTKEYILYLKIKPGENWWKEFIQLNNLKIDTVTKWTKPSDSPEWFQPTSNCLIYSSADRPNDSRYFIETLSGVCYIYEIQL